MLGGLRRGQNQALDQTAAASEGKALD